MAAAVFHILSAKNKKVSAFFSEIPTKVLHIIDSLDFFP